MLKIYNISCGENSYFCTGPESELSETSLLTRNKQLDLLLMVVYIKLGNIVSTPLWAVIIEELASWSGRLSSPTKLKG